MCLVISYFPWKIRIPLLRCLLGSETSSMDLKPWGKVYEESQKVMKILRSFPKQWKVKVMIIQNVKNLIELPLQWLISSLMTQEIKMKSHQEMEDRNKKSITPKAFIIKEKKKRRTKWRRWGPSTQCKEIKNVYQFWRK